MGLEFHRLSHEDGSAPADTEEMRRRYDAFFPRLFAYVRSCAGDDATAKEIAAEVFYRAFRSAAGCDDDQFQAALFRTARRFCRSTTANRGRGDGRFLNARERDVISLVFDAGLSRDQISGMFRMRSATVGQLLLTGLRKLKEQARAAGVADFQPA